jgi:hypothetical protein
MKQENMEMDKKQHIGIAKDDSSNGLSYPANEDIYNRPKKEADANTDDPLVSTMQNKDFDATVNREDGEFSVMYGLDVPGAELDDEMEKIGSEDEENNYYSLGLDNHNDLEENKE